MRKRILLTTGAVFLCLIVLLAGFCAIFWGYPETTDGVKVNSRVRMTVAEPVTTKDFTICFTIQNNSVRPIYWNERDYPVIDKKVNGEYIPIERTLSIDHTLGNRIYRPVSAFAEKESSVYTPYYVLQGGLEAGEYRIRQELNTRQNKKGKTFYAVGYFTVGVSETAA